ncbi:MAG: Hpt domain-containing protein [Burkholderiales bacterium]
MPAASSAVINACSTVRTVVGEALQAAARALATGAADAPTVAHAQWQAAHAALRVVNHKGLVQFSQELGSLISSASAAQPLIAKSVAAGAEALTGYMDEIIAGRRDQPLRLLPAYRDVQRARGVEQVADSDLFFPDLNVGPGDRAEAVAMDSDALRNTRRRLETGLLAWLRKADDPSGLRQVQDAVSSVEAAQSTNQARALWWVASAVLDAIANGGLTADNPVRRFITQLNLHLGRMVQGPAAVPEMLMRDALYLAARARAASPLVEAVQKACGLQGALDVDEGEVAEFGSDALTAARRDAEGLQDLWSACAAGDGDVTAFAQRVEALEKSSQALGQPAFSAVVAELAASARAIGVSGQKVGEAAALECACALLMIEHVLSQDKAPDAGFAQRAKNLAARLKVSVRAPETLPSLPPSQLLDDEAQRSQNQGLVTLVQGEATRGLLKVEQALESWFRDPAKTDIRALGKPLVQAAGALTVMGHRDAAALALQCGADIARYADGAPCDADAQQFLAKRLTALSAFTSDAGLGKVSFADIMARMGLPVPQSAVVPPERVATIAPVAFASAPAVELAGVPAAPVIAQPPTEVGAIDGGDDTDPEMLDIFLEEAGEVLSTIVATLPESRSQPQHQEHLTTLRRAFHTLKGSGRMIGLKHFGEAAWEMEQVFNEMLPTQQPGTPDLYRLVEYAHGHFGRWVAELQSQKRAHIDAQQLVAWAKKVRAGEALPLESKGGELPPESLVTQRSVTPPPQAPAVADDTVAIGHLNISRQLYDIFLPEAQNYAGAFGAHIQHVQNGAKVDGEFLRAVHTLSGISGTSGFPMVHNVGASLERVLQSAMDRDVTPQPEARELIARAAAALTDQISKISLREMPAAHPELVTALDAMAPLVGIASLQPAVSLSSAVPDPLAATMDFTPDSSSRDAKPGSAAAVESPIAQPVAAITAPAAVAEALTTETSVVSLAGSDDDRAGVDRRNQRVNDDVDGQLLPIFLAEAQELVPQVGQDLRDWRARPDDKLVPQSLKRLLHTLKGSARMAGAMALGQLTHSMESRVENASLLPTMPDSLFDDLESSFDRIGVLIENLQGTEEADETAAHPADLPDAMDQMAKSMRISTATVAVPVQAAAPVFIAQSEAVVNVQRPLIRVRADLIDRLANQAGEVSIARARVSAELRSARATLRDLSENVGRLRTQLREMEIQAETQMQSRFSPTPERADGKFDPLEFDRFTRLQELTRLMAESVNDVATVQQNLSRDLDEGEKALSAQAQMTREVQQDLMAIRMVPFSSLTDRLYRVTRLAAKDSGKRVQLDIKGGHVELDRGVLDRISAPIEHLLRNAIAHGVESPERRREAGKADAGELVIEVRQEGNEVVLIMTDDGAGLNIARIREKAVNLGLMRADETLTDQQIGNFIFRSGFSTAGEVTAVAGRGVGMDVVMSEISGLGGRVGTAFERGKGTTFTVHLPLTLSVLQGVVLRLGSSLYAVPTMMVEQLQRLKMDALAAARDAGKVEWQGNQYPFHHLRDLMELPAEESEPSRHGSVVLLRSGNHRVGIQIDDIVGGQEIVIKNIGPQLARVPGVTGAAVLGSGETVLILNPVQLALRAEEKSRFAVPVLGEPPPAGDVPAAPARQRIVLVVDDSLTVRKITGRLLSREGYEVVVAKDGVEALEKLQEQRPDVMITDVEMPRMDGFDLTRNVRADAALKGLPIIMITSRTADKHRQHATELGVDVFLGKPYEEGDLLGHIKTLAARPVSA